MNYLMDTCAISELVSKKPNVNVVKWIQTIKEENIFLSVLTLGEIQKGITKIGNKKRQVFLQNWLDSDLQNRFVNRILPVSLEVTLTWGTVQGESELKGKPIPVIDGLIGATALVYNQTVITRNEKDVALTGARIINPWIDS